MSGAVVGRRWLAAGAVLALASLLPLVASDYLLTIATLALYLGFQATAWNIGSGYAGLLSFGHHGFAGVGAYLSVFLLMSYGVSPWLGMFLGGGLSALLGVSLAWISTRYRMREVYFVLATFALATVLRGIVNNLPFVGSSEGLLLPVRNDPWHFLFVTRPPYYYVILVLTACALYISWWISSGALGLRLAAMREDLEAAEAMGIDSSRISILAMGTSTFVAGVGGAFYAQYIYFVRPDVIFDMALAINVLVAGIFGGLATVFGPLVGALALTVIQELSHLMPISASQRLAAVSRMMYGVVFVMIILFLPKGIISLRRPRWWRGRQRPGAPGRA
ncbi:MAG: branched-chain amino acid ABC transporter permease [Candidatus Rokubacteria bacterium]|nr:branched-chain amino acid ABC transporter permease [Candidatus Rokubacteria bacterium]